MIGNLIGAFIGERAGEHSRGINGPAGALIGAGAVAVIKRVSPIALLAAVLGGYALKRHHDRNHKEPEQPAPKRKPPHKK